MKHPVSTAPVRVLSAAVTIAVFSSAIIAAPRSPHANPSSQPQDASSRLAHARDRVFPALVHIDVITSNFYGGKETKGRSTGSGTIISPDGYVLTNAHVVADGKRFWCTLADKQRVPATLVGEDPQTDLAVLKIDTAKVTGFSGSLPHAAFADSSLLRVGDHVLAMGSPFALSRTVTLGIVSNTERVFTSGLGSGEADQMYLDANSPTGAYTNWIQHDALINPGNSGGPLVNLEGEVVGVNTRGGAGNGFATPANLAQSIAQQLITLGAVPRSSLGVSFRNTENTGIDRGVLVDSVLENTPAHRAGLHAGDVITHLGGEPVNVVFPEQLPPLAMRIASAPVGSELRLTVLRDAQTIELTAVTEAMSTDKPDEEALRAWGITAQQITDRAARARRIDNRNGVFVSSLRSGSPASLAEPSLGWGDIIRAVDETPVNNIADIVAAYERLTAADPPTEYVLVRFDREGKDFVTVLDTKIIEPAEPPREVPKPWVGIATQVVIPRLANQLGHPEYTGFRVTKVYDNTTAADSGIRVGDVVVALNGKRFKVDGPQDGGALARELRRLSIGDSATLTVLRDDGTTDLAVVLDKTRTLPSEAKRERDRDFELTVREITFFDRADNRWPEDLQGVIVDSAERAGWAELAGVRPGDLIQRIDRHDVTDLASFKAAMKSVAKEQPERVVFVVLRGITTNFRFAEPEWKPDLTDEDINRGPAAKDQE